VTEQKLQQYGAWCSVEVVALRPCGQRYSIAKLNVVGEELEPER